MCDGNPLGTATTEYSVFYKLGVDRDVGLLDEWGKAGMAELVDARDLKSLGLVPSGFKSRCPHHTIWQALAGP